MSKDVKGESKELGKGDYQFEIYKKKKKKLFTPYSEVNNTKIRKQLLQHEKIQGKTHHSAHVESPSTQGTQKASPLTQVYTDFP